MAITFTQERKKQRYLILVLALIIFVILLVVWWGFFREKEVGFPTPPSETFIPSKIEMDWEKLKDPKLLELQAFEEISYFEEEVGRENPFISY